MLQHSFHSESISKNTISNFSFPHQETPDSLLPPPDPVRRQLMGLRRPLFRLQSRPGPAVPLLGDRLRRLPGGGPVQPHPPVHHHPGDASLHRQHLPHQH